MNTTTVRQLAKGARHERTQNCM